MIRETDTRTSEDQCVTLPGAASSPPSQLLHPFTLVYFPLMLKLKLQCFGHLMQRTDSLEKTLMLGKIEGRRRRGGQRMRWFDGITDLMDMNLSKLRSW